MRPVAKHSTPNRSTETQTNDPGLLIYQKATVDNVCFAYTKQGIIPTPGSWDKSTFKHF